MTVTGTGIALLDERLERLLDEHPPGVGEPAEFWGSQYDLGLAPGLQKAVDTRLLAAGAPLDNRVRNILGWGMGAPVLVGHGTEDQQDRWLRPIFTCEEIWCQLFSEPGAGSDLAALATPGHTPEHLAWQVTRDGVGSGPELALIIEDDQ